MNADIALCLLYRLMYRQPAVLAARLEKAGSPARLLTDPDIAPQLTDELMDAAGADIDWLNQPGHHLIVRTDPDYPACLAEIYDPPWLLFARGDRQSLGASSRVAIVGSRKASPYGARQASAMAASLATRGIIVVSGLAMGIDAAAHEGALSAGAPTLAVLGTGCDLIYPKRNWRLAERIQETGLILSELPLRSGAFPGHFPRRNRIVTGLCLATLVIEAAARSGSLISARLALSEGREVMAVPGQVTNPQARGCHALMRDGAVLVESAEDVLQELGLSGGVHAGIAAGPSLDADQQALVSCLEQGPQSADQLSASLDLEVEELNVLLVTLEVLGVIHTTGGFYEISPRTG